MLEASKALETVMETPICDSVRDYCARTRCVPHMPGYKGRAARHGAARYHGGLTARTSCTPPLASSGRARKTPRASFGAARTLYSAEGSLAVHPRHADLALLHARENGLRPAVAAGRNATKVFLTAAALTGLEVDWLYPESPEACSPAAWSPRRSKATSIRAKGPRRSTSQVRITSATSPTSARLSAVCRRRGVLLLVDKHGAYLHFLPEPRHRSISVRTSAAIRRTRRCPP